MGASNVFANPAQEGIANDQGRYLEYCYTPIYTSASLPAGSSLNNQKFQLDGDGSAIFLHGVQLIGNNVTAGDEREFQIQLFDSYGESIFTDYILGKCLNNLEMSVPFPIVPARIFPPGGSIGINLRSYAPNAMTIQLAFRCVKRFEK